MPFHPTPTPLSPYAEDERGTCRRAVHVAGTAETTGALVEEWEGPVDTLVATTSVAGAAAPTVRSEHAERIEAAAAEVLSANTRRAYATAWRAWSAWCASEGIEPLPAQPVHVAAYLAGRAEDGVRGYRRCAPPSPPSPTSTPRVARPRPPSIRACAASCADSAAGRPGTAMRRGKRQH